MRMCVLGIMGEIVLRMLSLDNLEESSRDMRDQFLDHLEDHLHDVNAFVRVKVRCVIRQLTLDTRILCFCARALIKMMKVLLYPL
jgi:condensin complex subunit 1